MPTDNSRAPAPTDASNVTISPFLGSENGIPRIEDIARRIQSSYGGSAREEPFIELKRNLEDGYLTPEVEN